MLDLGPALDLAFPVPGYEKAPIWYAGHFYSGRSPSTYRYDPAKNERAHIGCDIAAPQGTPIVSPEDGITVDAGYSNPSAGWACGLKHPGVTLRGLAVFSRHVHIVKGGVVVKPGQRVTRGQKIAYVGSTGASAGPHDHTSLFLGSKFATARQYLLDPEPVYYPGRYELMQRGHPYPEDVKALQGALNKAGFRPLLKVDGDYGAGTATAVKWYQHQQGLAQTGEASEITLACLF